jgi:beta-galactosidase GanA
MHDLTRRTFGKAAAGGLFASAPGFGAAESASVFPYGTHIYREPPLPMEQLEKDLPLLKRLGFTMVKIQESWSTDERKEGEIDLSRTARLVSDARQNGLVIYYGITMEQAPAWLWRKFPDARMQCENGEPFTDPTQYLLPNDGKPGPCWNHSGARSAATRFIEAVGREIGKYDNILVWNVWQEVALDLLPGHLGLCYCPNTIGAFQTWLRGKYESLDSLNRFWRTSYGAWEEIDPPRRFTKVPSMVDWRYFMENVYLADALRFKADAFRRSDPGKRRILAHTGGPRYGGSADWRLSRSVDIYGCSAYPGWGEYQDPGVSNDERVLKSSAVATQLNGLVLQWDYIRSASVNGEFWDAELQGGRAGGGISPGRVPDARDIRRWVFAALAGGARGICFWNHRTEPFWDEGYGFGLMELRGGETDRAREAGRIAAAISARAADVLGRGAVPPAEAAIMIDEDLWNFASASGQELKDAFVANIRGLHQALWLEGVPVDFLDPRDMARAGNQYKTLIFPLPLALGPDVIGNLMSFVRSGGTLISGACPGRFDRYGFGMPGEMPDALAELFGIEHRQLISLSGRKPHPSQNTVKPSDAAPITLTGTGEFEGEQVKPAFYVQYLAAKGGKPILRYRDEVVGTTNVYGSGRAILIGTLPGSAVFEESAPENQAFLKAVISAAGVRPDRAGKLIRRCRVLASQAAWFLVNPTREAVEEDIGTEKYTEIHDLFDGPLTMRDGRVRVRVAPMDIACLVLRS